ncbi:MAG: universal stress protein [Euryarchaeota archaeon]|nr:universal stress protein [Euryarchaeota archaeon]
MTLIVIPINGSRLSMNAAKQAISWAKVVKKSNDVDIALTALYVVNAALVEHAASAPRGFFDATFLKGEITKRAEDNAREHLEKIKEIGEKEGIKVETKIRYGDPVAEIVKEAAESKAYMIMMGSHERTSLSELFFGNLTEDVAKKAPCPVVAIGISKSKVHVPNLRVLPFGFSFKNIEI